MCMSVLQLLMCPLVALMCCRYRQARQMFRHAVVLGVLCVAEGQLKLNPLDDLKLAAGDRLLGFTRQGAAQTHTHTHTDTHIHTHGRTLRSKLHSFVCTWVVLISCFWLGCCLLSVALTTGSMHAASPIVIRSAQPQPHNTAIKKACCSVTIFLMLISCCYCCCRLLLGSQDAAHATLCWQLQRVALLGASPQQGHLHVLNKPPCSAKQQHH